MKFVCPLVAVDDLKKSREFYETVLRQKVKFDFSENVVYEGDFSIQLKPSFAEMVKMEYDQTEGSNNFELYFEEEDFEGFLDHLKGFKAIPYLHEAFEHPWGQRVVRFYDPDRYIVEVGESMDGVALRFLNGGLSVEETSKRTQYPLRYVEAVNEKRKGEKPSGFPEFMKSEPNRIGKEAQNTEDIEGYYYEGEDGSQMAFWTCYADRDSKIHVYDFDEYMICVSGEYTAILSGRETVLRPGDELFIPKGTVQSGRCIAGTRSIHAFGGKRIQRNKQ